jgi:hypothetical protein
MMQSIAMSSDDFPRPQIKKAEFIDVFFRQGCGALPNVGLFKKNGSIVGFARDAATRS